MCRTFRSSFLVAIISLAVALSGSMLFAQSSDPSDLLVKKLSSQFAPTVFSQDYEIVTAGTFVALKIEGNISSYIQDPNRPRNGLVVFKLPLQYCPITTYKKGTLSMGFGDSSDVAHGDNLNINEFFSFPRRYLQIGDNFWIAGMSVYRNSIRVHIITDPYDDGRYCGVLKFPFEKGHLPASDDAVKMISEVLAVQPPPQRQPAAAEAPPVAVAEVAPLSLPSLYVSAQTPTNQLQLNAGGSLWFQEDGQTYHGTFVVRGATIELSISETGTKTILSRYGDDLTDSSGQTWNFRGHSPAATPSVVLPTGSAHHGAALRNDDIVKLVKVGIDDPTIIAKIESAACEFDTSTDALIQLKKSGVSPAVLKAIVSKAK